MSTKIGKTNAGGILATLVTSFTKTGVSLETQTILMSDILRFMAYIDSDSDDKECIKKTALEYLDACDEILKQATASTEFLKKILPFYAEKP